MGASTRCPHGDDTCPCPNSIVACRYEGWDALVCPNPPFDVFGLTNAHCHIEGCSWIVWERRTGTVKGECGLMKLGFPPAMTGPDGEPFWSMTQAKPGEPGWACGWLRTPLNVGNRE